MVRVFALLLILLPTPVWAQAEFSTIISPTTLGTSPLAVTIGTSPFGVICVAGCASAGASPSSVIVINTPTVSLSTSAPFVQQGTATWTVNLPTSPITVGTLTSGAIVNVMAAGTSALAIVPLTSPMAVALPGSPATVTLTNSPGAIVTSGAVVVNSAAGTSPLAVTLSSSPTAVAEQNGLAYPNRANWKQGSVTTTGTASAVVIPAPAANKLYITALQCWRSDAGTSPITMRFNDPAAQFTIAVANGQTNVSLNPALVMSATTSLQFSASTSLTSVGCNAQGYNNP